MLETATLAKGHATLTTVLLPSGVQSLTAYYAGNSTYAPSTSAVLMHTVNTVAGSGFQPYVSYPTPYVASSEAVGDFNGDGKPDLVVADTSAATGDVSVLLGIGDGTFQPAVNYAAGVNPYGPLTVAVGDFNGDGKPDLVAGNGKGGNLSVLLGNGDGTFQPALNYAPGGLSASSIAVGDFNLDGRADLAVTDSTTGEVTVLLGNGNGTFQAAVSYPTGTSPNSVVVGDFNGDGVADLAVANDGTGDLGVVSVLLGNGDGSFQPAVNYAAGSNPFAVATGDFNGDGYTDLAIANTVVANVSVLLGNGDGTFQAATNVFVDFTPTSIGVADFNGDGIADLAVASDDAEASVLLGNGDGTFQGPANYSTGDGALAVLVADFNGSGYADLALADFGGVSILLGSPATAPTTTTLAATPNPSTFGQAVTLKATVSPVTATGVVTFYGPGELGTATLSEGTAMLTTSMIPVGLDALTAVYGGDAHDAGSNSAVVSQTVNPATSSTQLTSSPDPSTTGESVTFSATVSPSTATGTVTFYHGSTSLGTGTLSGGTATLAVSTLTTGDHTITATYGGNADYSGSTSPGRVQIVKAATTSSTALTSSPNPSITGETVKFTATVSPSAATGTVTFYHGSTAMGTATLSGGTATLGVSTLTKGTHSITATYGGNQEYPASTSPAVNQVVE
jgi:hypothetical protein